jgi:hypothetical protein
MEVEAIQGDEGVADGTVAAGALNSETLHELGHRRILLLLIRKGHYYSNSSDVSVT